MTEQEVTELKERAEALEEVVRYQSKLLHNMGKFFLTTQKVLLELAQSQGSAYKDYLKYARAEAESQGRKLEDEQSSGVQRDGTG